MKSKQNIFFLLIFCLFFYSISKHLTQSNKITRHKKISNNVAHLNAKRTKNKKSRIPVSYSHGCSLLDTNEAIFSSQSQEDKHLMMFFNGLCNGTYVELGALDGLLFSNTLVFNKALQWRGLLLDASPLNFEKLKVNRQNEIAVMNVAVCNTQQTVHYLEGVDVGGIWEFTTKEFRDLRWGVDRQISDTKLVQCLPLKDVFINYGNPFYADFFSLDVEGSELTVLESIDFNKASFGIIFIEADTMNATKNVAARQLLLSHGYIFLYWYQRSDWFINEHFSKIYQNHQIEEAVNFFNFVSKRNK